MDISQSKTEMNEKRLFFFFFFLTEYVFKNNALSDLPPRHQSWGKGGGRAFLDTGEITDAA